VAVGKKRGAATPAHRGKSPEARTGFRQAVYEQIRHADGQQPVQLPAADARFSSSVDPVPIRNAADIAVVQTAIGSYGGGLWAVASALVLSGMVVLLVRSGAKRRKKGDSEPGSAGLGGVTRARRLSGGAFRSRLTSARRAPRPRRSR
jgi:hypothetical protein